MSEEPAGPPPAKRARPVLTLGLVGLFVLLAAVWLVRRAPVRSPGPASTVGGPAERVVQEIPLQGPAAKSEAEISGLAWYSDTLILLPQYPQRMAASMNGAIFGLSRSQVTAAFAAAAAGTPIAPPEMREIPLDSRGIEAHIPGFEGYEAIAFLGDQAYLTIEARRGRQMMGYIIHGHMEPGMQALRLDPASLTENPPQVDQDNHTDEALLVTPERVLSFFESNGAGLNPAPHATVFDLQLKRLAPLPLPALEYRLTDASPPDDQGRFWVINYFFPGNGMLKPKRDPLAVEYGQGATHAHSSAVERLVEYQLTDQGIVRTHTPPVQLQLRPDGEARNWEGLALLPGAGFILATDKFPRTILGVVPYP